MGILVRNKFDWGQVKQHGFMVTICIVADRKGEH